MTPAIPYPEATYNGQQITEEYLRANDLRLVRYYNRQILGTAEQLKRFCMEGILNCMGATRDHLTEIFFKLVEGEIIAADSYAEGREDLSFYHPVETYEDFFSSGTES